jgi:hypothetical protein
MLMCRIHWGKVPRNIKEEVRHHYRPGQERDKKPTPEYVAVARMAIAKVAVIEGKMTDRDAVAWVGECFGPEGQAEALKQFDATAKVR